MTINLFFLFHGYNHKNHIQLFPSLKSNKLQICMNFDQNKPLKEAISFFITKIILIESYKFLNFSNIYQLY
jgi:hypothetical protein